MKKSERRNCLSDNGEKNRWKNLLFSLLIAGMVFMQNTWMIQAKEKEAEEEIQVQNEILPSGLAVSRLADEIESYVQVHEKTTAGLSVAVYNQQKVIYQNNFGYADKERSLEVNDQTVFEWGSISKLLVWISVMQLAEEGKLELEADIQNYLPKGFLKNLTYEKPITMVDLMNHQGGFQETYFIQTDNAKEICSLEEALSRHQPAQIYEPGTITAYSNWSASLAAYIVERVSGVDYIRYVHEHILNPLEMKHTSIGPVLEDNDWVSLKRMNLSCYDADGEKIDGKGMYYIFLYPSGSVTGTLSDLLKFARALIPEPEGKSPLFKEKETLEKFFTPTSYYGSSGVANNCHGLFTSEYGIETLGHGGNTFGCSTMIQFDPKSGVGMIVMTNQAHETIYNYDLYELVFGKFTDSQLANLPRTLPAGLISSSRTIRKGPLSLSGVLGITGFEETDLDSWWWQEGNVIYTGYSDFFLSDTSMVFAFVLALLFMLAGVYGLFTDLVGGLIIYPVLCGRQKKKGLQERGKALRLWNYASCLCMAAILIDTFIIFVRLSIGNQTGNIGSIDGYSLQFALTALFSLLLAISLIIEGILFFKKYSLLSRKEKFKGFCTFVFGICMIFAIGFFELWKFWAL